MFSQDKLLLQSKDEAHFVSSYITSSMLEEGANYFPLFSHRIGHKSQKLQ